MVEIVAREKKKVLYIIKIGKQIKMKVINILYWKKQSLRICKIKMLIYHESNELLRDNKH